MNSKGFSWMGDPPVAGSGRSSWSDHAHGFVWGSRSTSPSQTAVQCQNKWPKLTPNMSQLIMAGYCAAFLPLMSLFLILNQYPMVISHPVAFISQLCRDYCRIKGALIRLLGRACALPLAMEMNHSRDFYLPSNQRKKKPLFSSASKPACK